jgi:rhodanese-related sulfurtransferase
MKDRKLFYLLYLFIAATIMFVNVGCSEDEDPITPDPVNETEVLLNYLEANNDYIHTSGSFVIGATDVNTLRITNPTQLFVIDIRDAAAFSTGHIEGAVRVDFANLYDYIKTVTAANYSKVVLTCYSGQTSAYAVSLIRALGGYNNVVSLKWGMSSWDSVFAQNYWLAKISNAYATQFVTTPSPAKNPKGNLPTFTSTGKTTGPEILVERVKALFAAGYSAATVAPANVFQTPADYYVANYWTNALYLNPGHIPGSINYDNTAQPFKSANDLKTLPIDKKIALYCFTGQTSSYVGAYLRLLGYDVKSLTYGANSMIYDLMVAGNVANTFIPATEIKKLPYVTGN